MKETKKPGFFERFSDKVTVFTGGSTAFSIAAILVLVWGISGPFFDYSETWQLVINTGTTIVTFLMVFLIQKSTNKESKSIQLKLNELIASIEGASNRLVNVENLSEKELDTLREKFAKLNKEAKAIGKNIQAGESIEMEIEKDRKEEHHQKKEGKK